MQVLLSSFHMKDRTPQLSQKRKTIKLYSVAKVLRKSTFKYLIWMALHFVCIDARKGFVLQLDKIFH